YNGQADGFVVVIDSDHTPIHQQNHESPDGFDSQCRVCLIRKKMRELQGHVGKRPSRAQLKTVVGLAVPEISAWYLCGKDQRVGETPWIEGLRRNSPPYTIRDLKVAVFGKKERLPLGARKERAEAEARRLVQNLALLEQRFPNGFGLMAAEIRGWLT